MNAIGETKTRRGFGDILLLMLICLVALIAGNGAYHSDVLPVTDAASQYLLAHFSLVGQTFQGIVDFLWMTMVAARGDVLCVLLVAISPLIRIPRLFICAVFAYRAFLFGFCGAYIIGMIGDSISFAQGGVWWGLFFLYHILFFSVLICFASSIFARTSQHRVWRKIGYAMTVCGEMALVIFLNVIYYFLISKI